MQEDGDSEAGAGSYLQSSMAFGSRAKARVQASGSISWTAGLSIPAAAQRIQSAFNEFSSLGIADGPAMQLYLHTALRPRHLVTAKLATSGGLDLAGASQDREVSGEVSESARSRQPGAAPQFAAGPQLLQLLYRGEIGNSWRFLVAPLGGCLQAISTPLVASVRLGVSNMLHASQGLYPAAAVQGSGVAASYCRGAINFTAGCFARSEGTTSNPNQPASPSRLGTAVEASLVQDQGLSLALSLWRSTSRFGAFSESDTSSSSQPKFWGLDPCAVPFSVNDAHASPLQGGSHSGVSITGAYNHADSLVLSASLQRNSCNGCWHVGLQTHPNAKGMGLGAVLGKQLGKGGFHCEVSAAKEVSVGLSVKPCVLLLQGDSGQEPTTSIAVQTVLRY